jgi:serine/threonine protein kinase
MDEHDLLTGALAISDPTARAAFLDRVCEGKPELRRRVNELLAGDGRGRGRPDPPSGDPTGPTVHAGSPPSLGAAEHTPNGATATVGGAPTGRSRLTPAAPGAVIAGRYTLVEVIGEGGMGSVYLADQTEPVKRQVALKVIRAGTDSKAVLARFDAERQALALMDHPNIARIYDGGVTPSGQPFFVMELVRGVRLTDYCDRKRLCVPARLELFVAVCLAVQHAHQKGIIHRDLKPGNVLVTEVDGKPVPKVIDFGVAKATEQKLTDLSFSEIGAIVGTPAYMSPEQADPAAADIDTRTDVYAMGVILYELLTGSPPVDAGQFKRGAVLEMLRLVREVEPPRPSTKLSTADALPNIAANRDIEPAKLARLLRGELDWVVMKALEKDRNRRYETANGLARDVQRYLAHEVVEARPPSAGYRLKKFVKRNKVQVIAASLVLFALLAGIAGTTWGLIEARRQEQIARAETVAKEEARQAEAARAEGERLAKQDAQTAREKAEQNAQTAGIQATLALNTVQSLISLTTEKLQGPGLFETRQALLEVALKNVDRVADVYDKAPTSKEATTMAALVELGSIYRQLGHPDKASRNFLKALEIGKQRIVIKKGSDPSRRNLAVVYSNLGAVAEELNRDLQAALDYHLKALALFEDIDRNPMLADSPFPRPVVRAGLAEAYKLVGVCYYRVGKLDEALPYFRKAYDLARELAAAQPKDTALHVNLTKSAMALGSTAYRTGDRAQADKFLAEARELAQQLFAARPKDVVARSNLADFLYINGETRLFAGKLAEARADLQACLKLYDEIARADPRNVYHQRNLSKAYSRLGTIDLLENKPDAARVQFDAALKIRSPLAEISKENDRRHMELMLAQALVGQVDAAVAIADRLGGGAKVDSELRMDLARCYAIASRTLPKPDTGRAEALRVKAMEALRAAVKDGYRDRGYLEGEPDFVPLRDRGEFKALVGEMQTPTPRR